MWFLRNDYLGNCVAQGDEPDGRLPDALRDALGQHRGEEQEGEGNRAGRSKQFLFFLRKEKMNLMVFFPAVRLFHPPGDPQPGAFPLRLCYPDGGGRGVRNLMYISVLPNSFRTNVANQGTLAYFWASPSPTSWSGSTWPLSRHCGLGNSTRPSGNRYAFLCARLWSKILEQFFFAGERRRGSKKERKEGRRGRTGRGGRERRQSVILLLHTTKPCKKNLKCVLKNKRTQKCDDEQWTFLVKDERIE